MSDAMIEIGALWVRASIVGYVRVLDGDEHGPRVIVGVMGLGPVVIDADTQDAAHGLARQIAAKCGFSATTPADSLPSAP